MQITEVLKEKLIKLARGSVSSDDEDFCVYDQFGGNIDDAYYGGRDEGEVILAQEILDELGISYKDN